MAAFRVARRRLKAPAPVRSSNGLAAIASETCAAAAIWTQRASREPRSGTAGLSHFSRRCTGEGQEARCRMLVAWLLTTAGLVNELPGDVHDTAHRSIHLFSTSETSVPSRYAGFFQPSSS